MLDLLQCIKTLTLELDFHFVELKELTCSQIRGVAQVVSNNYVAEAKSVFNALWWHTMAPWHAPVSAVSAECFPLDA